MSSFVRVRSLPKTGEWNEARKRYEKSLALKRAPLTLYSLGIAYRNLRRFVEALESHRAFLVEMPANSEAMKPYEQPARDAIAELEKQVAKLDIHVAPDDAADLVLSIDGIIIAEAARGYPRLVDLGKHTVVARARGYRDATRIVDVTEGQKLTVALRLDRRANPARSAEMARANRMCRCCQRCC